MNSFFLGIDSDDIFQEAANEVLSAMREKCEEAFRSSGVCAQLLSKHEWDKMESPIKVRGWDRLIPFPFTPLYPSCVRFHHGCQSYLLKKENASVHE